ncbi:MAG TPA: hypothetical protein VFP40_14205 [Terriglobales bacterium]|nr:hypothetical protein [Terriglobales bacterium]
MKTIPDNKYNLRDLHQEIALTDRKISHAQNVEPFEDENDRITAVSKLQNRREELVRTAEAMAERGVEYDLKDLPPSMKTSFASRDSQ